MPLTKPGKKPPSASARSESDGHARSASGRNASRRNVTSRPPGSDLGRSALRQLPRARDAQAQPEQVPEGEQAPEHVKESLAGGDAVRIRPHQSLALGEAGCRLPRARFGDDPVPELEGQLGAQVWWRRVGPPASLFVERGLQVR